jgi:phosphotransferase system HPr (HPr) family protein
VNADSGKGLEPLRDELESSKSEVKIRNSLGLHARPAAKFVQIANEFRSKVSVEKEGHVVNGKSVMGLMMLAAAKGSKLVIEAQGEDAEEAVDKLEQLIDEGFGED